MEEIEKHTVDYYLNNISYEDDPNYIPSDFAIEFVNFIKLVNGSDGEEHATPVLHYKMLDQVQGPYSEICNLIFRGAAKAVGLDTQLPTPNGNVSMRDLSVGDIIFDRDGKPTQVTNKSEVFKKPSYIITLIDGRSLTVSEDHLNTVLKLTTGGAFKEHVLTTKELVKSGIHYVRKVGVRNPTGKESKWFVPTAGAMQISLKNLPLDPYTVGIILGDGSISESGFTRIHTHIDDMAHYVDKTPYTTSCHKPDLRNPNVYRFSLLSISKEIKSVIGTENCYGKRVPSEYLWAGNTQRLELLRGLMDTDGTVSVSRKSSTSFTSTSEGLASDVAHLVRGLGGEVKIKRNCWGGRDSYRVSIRMGVNPFSLPRKSTLWRPNLLGKIAIKSVVPTEVIEETQCISVSSPTRTFLTDDMFVTHNTTVFGEYLFLYLAVYGSIPGFGDVPLAIYVSDSIENGVKNMRKNLEFRRENSEFLMTYIPKVRFTDIRWEFINADGDVFLVKSYGAKALSLDSILHTSTGTTTIGDCVIGDMVYAPNGKLTRIIEKSEVFNKPMYRMTLVDGRTIKVSEDHINTVLINTNPNNSPRWVEHNLTTKELLDIPLTYTKKGNYSHRGTVSKSIVCVENTRPLEYPENTLPIDPYLLGLLLGDGSMKSDGSVCLCGLSEDIAIYKTHINEMVGSEYLDKRNMKVVSISLLKMSERIKALELRGSVGVFKFIPSMYLVGSIDQRLSLLQGLLDTDGTIGKSGRISFSSTAIGLIEGVTDLVRSLGGTCYAPSIREATEKWSTAYKVEILMPVNPFKLPRKSVRWFYRERQNERVALVSIVPIEIEPSQCIAVDSPEHQFLTDNYFRTHNTGVRGTKELGVRPYLAVLDDMISDEDARSDTILEKINEIISKALDYALHPTRQKTIWSGTPFNAKDPLYKAVESGAWKVNVFPVCEEFPCTKEDFRGGWEDRFTYEFVRGKYEKARKSGNIESFNQELMLRILSDEDRLVRDCDIAWYKLDNVLKFKRRFNFYITTDFATSEKKSADFSVIDVWAYSSNGDWLWVDGIVKRQLMDKNIADLFTFVQKYKPEEVGMEVSGQQGGFVQWLQGLMMQKDTYFTLASSGNSNNPGIRPTKDKFVRFLTVLPLFKNRKILFPEELKTDPRIIECMDELTKITPKGFKSKHDDCIDTKSMLMLLNPWKPSQDTPNAGEHGLSIWEEDEDEDEEGIIESYVV